MTWLARIAWPFVVNYVKSLIAKKAFQLALTKVKALLNKKAK